MTSWNDMFDEYVVFLKTRDAKVDLGQLFNALPTEKKISFTYDLLKCDNILPCFTNNYTKSTLQATKYRNLGNRAFGLKKDIDALKCYTSSIAASPTGSEELALAYANRSAVLFKLGKFSSSLLDANRALKNNYPESLKPKVHNRKKKCLANLQIQNGHEFVHLDMSSKFTLSESGEHIDTKSASSNWELMEHCTESSYDDKFQLPTMNSQNENIPNASEKMGIDWSSKMGRCLVATQNIEPGEILAVEKPYASILLPEFYLSHCSFCFVRCETLIPCNGCSLVMFCSNNCYQRALNLYHQTECKILPFLVSLKLGKMELLALRTLLVATKQGKELNSLHAHPDFKNPFTKKHLDTNKTYISLDYVSVHNLEDNFSKLSLSEMFRRAATTVVVLYALKHSTFFDKSSTEEFPYVSEKLTNVEIFAGILFLKYFLVILCNAHEISEWIEQSIKTTSVEIGAALYPLLSLTNHSCDPNVVRHSYRDVVVLRTIQSVNKGEQLFDNYSYHYAIHSREERQSQLRLQYFFDCNCDPCKFDWPLYQNLRSEPVKYLTDRQVDITKLKSSSKLFRKIISEPLNLCTDEHFEFLLKYLSLLHNSVIRPSKEYNECQESIKQIMAYRANHYTLKDIVF